MAGDKKTILDIVDKVDEMNFWKTSMNQEITRPDLINKHLVSKAMEEEHPTAGGTYEGSVYYSNILPEDQGDLPWTKEAATIVKKASQTRARKSDILAAQNYFADIGYMHHSEVDGKPGKQFHGLISRWNKNAGVSKEAMFDAMETWKDNIFGGEE